MSTKVSKSDQPHVPVLGDEIAKLGPNPLQATVDRLRAENAKLREDKERLDWMAQSYDNAGLNEVRAEEEAQCFEEWYGKLKRAGKGNAYAVRFAIDMARQTKAELTALRSQGDKL